jgi:hypothetical protein
MLIRIDEESHTGSASNHGEIYNDPRCTIRTS